MQMYPDWSSRTNASRGKKRKRKQDTTDGGNNMKKCRARFGLDQQNQWCKPCRRKKKCIRYMEVEGEENSGDLDNHVSDDNLGSCGSVDDVKTPEDDTESLNQSLSSPGCLSGLSSLQSPSTSLASPLNLLTSPSTPNTIHNSHEQLQQLHQTQHQPSQQQIQHHQSLFAENTQQQQQQQQQQQHNDDINSNHTLNNVEKNKKCVGNNINNNNNSDIMNSTTLNKHASSLSSLISSAHSASIQSSSVSLSSSISNEFQRKTDKLTSCTSISPLLGVHLAAMGISPNDQLTTIPSLTSSSSSPSSSIPNHLFMDSINKISIVNVKSPRTATTSSSSSSSSSVFDISDDMKPIIQPPSTNLRMQLNSDHKSTACLKLLTHQQLNPHHHQQYPHQNPNINQNSSNNSNNNNNVQSTPTTLTSSSFSADIFLEKAIRNPVGANPRDVNNPLNINQLTKRDYIINTPSSPPTTLQQPLSTLSQSPTSHHHISQQHHPHLLTTSSAAPISSSSLMSMSIFSSSTTSSNIHSLTNSKSSSLLSPIKAIESNSNPFAITTIDNGNGIRQSSMQNLQSQHHSLHKQQHEQQQQQLQGLYQPPISSSSSPSSSSHQNQHHHHNHHQQQQNHHHHHHHNLAIGQHLHNFSSHHFPVVTGSAGNQNNVSANGLSTISTKSSPAVPKIGGQSNPTHHRSSDSDSGAISVT